MSGRNVLVVSMRGYQRLPAYTAWFEFEDLIVEWEDAEILELPFGLLDQSFRWPRAVYQALRAIGVNEEAALKLPSRSPKPLRASYDLIIVTLSSFFDLFAGNGLRSLLTPGGKLVAMVIESWPSEVKQRATRIEPIGQFDEIYMGLSSGSAALTKYLDRRIRYLAPAGDVLSSRSVSYGRRSIAAVNPGRRSTSQHQLLLDACAKDGRPYIYDTISGGEVMDHRSHRQNYNSLLRQSELLVCNYAKFDRPEVIGETRDLPGRLYEGLAAGNVLAGQLPPQLEEGGIGLGEAVIVQLPLNGKSQRLDDVLLDEGFLREAKRKNHRIAASGHDWVHRWAAILRDLGLEPTSNAVARLDSLAAMASE